MHQEPKVISRIAVWAPTAPCRGLLVKGPTKRPFRLWTMYDHMDHGRPPSTLKSPQHNHGAFLEDHIHDWVCRMTDEGLLLNYYSRVIDQPVWLLLEFT